MQQGSYIISRHLLDSPVYVINFVLLFKMERHLCSILFCMVERFGGCWMFPWISLRIALLLVRFKFCISILPESSINKLPYIWLSKMFRRKRLSPKSSLTSLWLISSILKWLIWCSWVEILAAYAYSSIRSTSIASKIFFLSNYFSLCSYCLAIKISSQIFSRL